MQSSPLSQGAWLGETSPTTDKAQNPISLCPPRQQEQPPGLLKGRVFNKQWLRDYILVCKGCWY